MREIYRKNAKKNKVIDIILGKQKYTPGILTKKYEKKLIHLFKKKEQGNITEKELNELEQQYKYFGITDEETKELFIEMENYKQIKGDKQLQYKFLIDFFIEIQKSFINLLKNK